MSLFRRSGGEDSPIGIACAAAGLRASDVTAVDGAPVDVWITGDLDPVEALRCWRSALGVHAGSGLYPVLVGPGARFRVALADAVELDLTDGLDAAADVLARQLAFMVEDDEEEIEPNEVLAEEPELPDPMPGTDGALLSLDGPQAVAFVAAPTGSAVPGLLAWTGAVNYDLSGRDHSSVLGEWERAWGAQLVVLGFDVIELEVSRPPRAAADVLALARDHYVYCPDIVDQGVGSLEALCPVVASRHWFFWWD